MYRIFKTVYYYSVAMLVLVVTELLFPAPTTPTAGANQTPNPVLTDGLKRPPLDPRAIEENLRRLSAPDSMVHPQFLGLSDTMQGRIIVSVFFVESNGAIDPDLYTWTPGDHQAALQSIRSGLDWWESRSSGYALQSPLNYTIVDHGPTSPECSVPYEPVTRPAADSSVWVNSVMSNLGANSGSVFDQVAALNRMVRDSRGSDWAFSVFLAYNPTPAPAAFTDGRSAFAYLGGPFSVQLWRSFSWPLQTITTHETGHIFWACDEYSQLGLSACTCLCDSGPRSLTNNDNCTSLGCGSTTVPCIMRFNEDDLCPRTPDQVGWGTRTLTILTGSLPSGTVGQQYSVSLTASGGTIPYSWDPVPTPPGLSITSTGTLAGVPLAGGTFTLTPVVRDSLNHVASRGPPGRHSTRVSRDFISI